MKKDFKILIILIILLSFSACKKEEKIPTPIEKTLEDKINELNSIDINTIEKNSVKLSAYYINNIVAIVNPAISYPETEYNSMFSSEYKKTPKTNSSENEGDINAIENHNEVAKINLSSELMFEIKYTGDVNEIPKKIVVNSIKIKSTPLKGKLEFYAVVDGNENDYLYKIKNNKIYKEFEYKKDLVGNELKDGMINLRFSSLIDNIYLTDTNTLQNKNYKELLKNNDINIESLKYSITFNIIIYTDNNVFVLPFDYEFKDIDLSKESMYKLYTYKEPLYFYKVD